MKSHFVNYMMEREGAETIENEKGFICYKFDDNYCIITDIYIAPEHRLNKIGRSFGEQVEEKAKEKGAKGIICYADRNANNFTEATDFILKNDYKILNTSGSLIYFKKDL